MILVIFSQIEMLRAITCLTTLNLSIIAFMHSLDRSFCANEISNFFTLHCLSVDEIQVGRACPRSGLVVIHWNVSTHLLKKKVDYFNILQSAVCVCTGRYCGLQGFKFPFCSLSRERESVRESNEKTHT